MAKYIFEQGDFNAYMVDSLYHAKQPIMEPVYEMFSQQRTTVFISHKHDELEDLKGIIGFLEKTYNVKAYIDSKDSSMPAVTSGETATRIKDRIDQCDKFILLATNKAIEAKWCNWELGYGDAKKFKKNIALFPMKPKGDNDTSYKGNEYMSIYPYITYFDGTEQYSDTKKPIPKGYYVRYKEKDSYYITELSKWLRDK